MSQRPQRSRVAVGLFVSATTVGMLSILTPTANAAPSCVAQFVRGPAGPPGQFQREAHVPRFGQNVSFVAHLPREACFS